MTQVSMTLTKGQATQGQFFPKMGKKNPKNLSYLGGYFNQPNKAHLMIQVPMTLTKGQGHRSRSNIQKSAKIYKMGNISDAISPTDFIQGTTQ